MVKENKFFFAIIFLSFFLRFFMLGSYPPGLYSDEAALGYNAYSLLKTGRDEYGRFWPMTLQSFGDYKPPLSSWAMIPFIAIFDLNEFSVRFPFALAGALSVILIYYLSLELFKNNKNKQTISLVSALFLAISPWHLHQSRSAMLVGLEVFFNALGVFLFLKGIKKNYLLVFSSFSFSLAVYAYYGSRITSPIIILILFLVYRKEFSNNIKRFLIFIGGFVLLIPLFSAIARDPMTILGRAKYMSIFYDQNVAGQLWEAKTLDGPDFPTLLTRFFHNKPFYYAKDILRRWLGHFEPAFLFIVGGTVAPFRIPNMGLLYLADLLFLLIGLYNILKKKRRELIFLLLWLLSAPVVSSLTFITPSTNRNFNMVFPLYIIISLGLVSFLSGFMKFKKQAVIVVAGIYIFLFSFYLYQYYHSIPFEIPENWSYGRRVLTQKMSRYEKDYNKVVLSSSDTPPYIFLLFYKQYDPVEYWKTMRQDSYINDLGWGHIEGFDKYEIPRQFNWKEIEKKPGILYISNKEEVPDVWQEPVGDKQMKVNILDKVYYPSGQTAFKIFDLKEVENE